MTNDSDDGYATAADAAAASLPDECPECGGLVGFEVRRWGPEGVEDATAWCAGASHRDDGTGCEWEVEFPLEGDGDA